ncbi:hypothetical protein [Streptomyces sp. NPDC007988]|uniref:hypothetical protein n=1 Tax=Streptomyces sp. NPDC007988 TaxID=3364802 RepID=UPI0036E163F6
MAPQTATEVEVVFLDGQQVTASYPGTLRHLGRGSIGRSVNMELAGGCMQLMISDHSDAPASLRFTFSLEPLEPAAALRLLRIHQHIVAGGAFQVRARAGVIGGGDLHAKPEAARQEAAELRRYLEDLEVVQRHCEQYFPVPAELAPAERIALRMARLLVDGHCVISPFMPQARFTLNGQDSPVLRALLSGEPHAVRGECGEFAITLAGRRLDLGPVLFFHPRVTTAQEDAQQALAALDAGRGDGPVVTVRPADKEHFRLQLQSATTRDEPVPAPLALPGLPEPH